MKTADDPRHKKRQYIIQELFKVEFHDQQIAPEAQKILDARVAIDEHVQRAAPEFPLDKINRIDLAILRLAVFELLIEKKEPENVIIDEAIELAKEFSGDSSPAFVNGVLGNIVKYAKEHSDIQK